MTLFLTRLVVVGSAYSHEGSAESVNLRASLVLFLATRGRGRYRRGANVFTFLARKEEEKEEVNKSGNASLPTWGVGFTVLLTTLDGSTYLTIQYCT